MKKIAKALGVLCLAALSLSCSNLFDEKKFVDYYRPYEFAESKETVQITSKINTQAFTGFTEPCVIPPFAIGTTEVTYVQWYTVYQWAIKNGYKIPDAGIEGYVTKNAVFDGTEVSEKSMAPADIDPDASKIGAKPSSKDSKLPVSYVSLRSVILWCNAASEHDGLEPVYLDPTTNNILRSAESNNDEEYSNADSPVIKEEANGYRLPTIWEWEFTSKGGNQSSDRWNNDYSTDEESENYLGNYAWYKGNSLNSDNQHQVHNVATKDAEEFLGTKVYDFKGNLNEWYYGRYPGDRYNTWGFRGGSFLETDGYCSNSKTSESRLTGLARVRAAVDIGFRLCKSLPVSETPDPVEPETPDPEEPETPEEYTSTETYHTDFTSTRFYNVKDVYRDSTKVYNPSYPYSSTGKTTASDWTEGSYVMLKKNTKTYYVAGKTVPTYTETLYTKQSDGTYKTKILFDDVKIEGICDVGFLALSGGTSGTYYGTFFYTNWGWAKSVSGTQSLSVKYDKAYPTYEEITELVKTYYKSN